MGNDDVLMGILPKYSVLDLIRGRKSLEEVIVDGPKGIKLLPGGSGLNNIEDLQAHERNIFLNKIEQLEGFDFILIDTGAGISRSVLAFIACSEELILVTTPEPTSLTDGYSLIKAVDHFKIKTKASIIVNKVLDKEEGQQTFNKFRAAVERFLNIRVSYLGCIYEDRKLLMAVREQVPFMISYPKSDASNCILKITNIILEHDEESIGVGAKGLFRKLFDIFS
ncbi:Putative Site-determining protein [Clostridium chauvoei JF4335]|nr:Putative Site-determining protein [Clostridium chauvoei JF4335]